jgi:Tfp pilus assembly protein PilN
MEAEMDYARGVLQQLDVPWDELFEAVEASTNEEVALLGIEPEPRQETVRIIGEAKSYPAVLEYTRRLEESAPLKGVHLQNHQIQTRDRERPVHFVLGATWRRQP